MSEFQDSTDFCMTTWRPFATLSRHSLIMLIASANLIELKWKLIKCTPEPFFSCQGTVFTTKLIEAATLPADKSG